MPEDDKADGLRIGRWVPPYRDAAGPLDPPILRPPMTAVQRVGVIAGLPRAAVATGPRRRTLLVAAVVAAVLATATMFTLTDPDRPAPSAAPADRMLLPIGPEPSAPVSLLPPPTEAASSPVAFAPPPARRGTSPSARRPSPTRTSAAATTAPPAAALTAGSTVGLEVAGRPGDRLRHRDFVARIDRITARSSALDRADSSFAVRRGLASPGCVSLESVNYPGYFLRHRDFVLRLERRDRSSLFAQDATFCTEHAGSGAVLLRAVNYPSRALSAGSDRVRLTSSGPTAFVARAAL